MGFLIMMDYATFPPVSLFKKVLFACPETALLYASLWDVKHGNRVSIKRDEVKRYFLISPTLFRNYLLALSRLGILTMEETPTYFLIDFYDV